MSQRTEPERTERAEPERTERTEPERTELERLGAWLDERTGAATITRNVLRKVFPDHWSFLLGEIALFCYVVLVATGVFLTFFFAADTRSVTYEGPYPPLRGESVSAAFDSIMRLTFEVRAGLLMRQIHHWAALVFVVAIVVHICRVFFTGAFRRPREINWLVGVGLLLLALAAGLTGYSLPDDLLSGTGLRIVYSVVFAIPFIGPWLAYLVFGGEFPTAELIGRLYVFHIMLLPALTIGLIAAHLGIMWIQKHTQFRGERARETNVVGRHFWPGQAFRSLGMFFVTAAGLALLGGLVQINPVWIYGPFLPYAVSSPAQPDWYVGWLEGALRIGPNWEPTILGVTIPSPFLPGILLPAIVFGGFALWPFIEARLTGDHRVHHLLDLPWQAPGRLAVGAATLTLFLVLTLAGGNDVLAVTLHVEVEDLTRAFRVLVFVAPPLVGVVAYRLAVERARRAGPLGPPGGLALHRTATGGFEETE
ncbi:MAG: ubiquinol-cytochrome c reductase cytochrome b subunit [Chloroflexota bacterium]|nr:ubiquinol-cytochrome c reductase cytochrome b subunit [Chloroflexota bacterium]